MPAEAVSSALLVAQPYIVCSYYTQVLSRKHGRKNISCYGKTCCCCWGMTPHCWTRYVRAPAKQLANTAHCACVAWQVFNFEWYFSLRSIIRMNAFSCPSQQRSDSNSEADSDIAGSGAAMYFFPSFLNHSCGKYVVTYSHPGGMHRSGHTNTCLNPSPNPPLRNAQPPTSAFTSLPTGIWSCRRSSPWRPEKS